MRYTSTRDKNVDVSSSWAIAQGISADGGLFVPVEIPKVSLDDIAAMANMSYVERAKRVLSLYLTDFTAEELADMCGMSHSHFRSLFEKYYGCPPADWLRRERMERIRTDMSYRPELTVGEIAERNDFPSASNFSDFCRRQFDRSPQELKAEGEEEWRERRLEWWNGDRR